MTIPGILLLVVCAAILLGVAIYAFTNPHNIVLSKKANNQKSEQEKSANN